jgi:hypothetical protein
MTLFFKGEEMDTTELPFGSFSVVSKNCTNVWFWVG